MNIEDKLKEAINDFKADMYRVTQKHDQSNGTKRFILNLKKHK